MKKTASFVFIFISAALWGTIALFYDKLSLLGFSPIQIVFLRVTAAFLITAGYLTLSDRTLFRIRPRDLWIFVGSGIVSLAFFNYCYFRAIDTASASTAAVLLYTAPAIVMVLSAIFFREKLTVVKILALALTLVGCVLVTELIFETRITVSGVLFGFGSGFGYALYTIFGKIALRRYRTETITLYTFLFAAISLIPLCQPSAMFSLMIEKPTDTAVFSLGIGFFVTFLPYLLYTKGLQQVPAGQASIIATVEPVVATLLGVTVLNDRLSSPKIIGIILILGAIILVSIYPSKKISND